MGDFRMSCKFSLPYRSLCRRTSTGKVDMHSRRRPITVLLVEDNDIYAQTVEHVLAASEAVDVVGRARDGAEGVGLAFALEPDCILMDLSMPVLDGFEATRAIRSRLPLVRVVILTSSDDPSDRAEARAAGATDYLTKECPLHELEAAVTGGPSLRTTPCQGRSLLESGVPG
jgi:CheY-like chemotaxis protein